MACAVVGASLGAVGHFATTVMTPPRLLEKRKEGEGGEERLGKWARLGLARLGITTPPRYCVCVKVSGSVWAITRCGEGEPGSESWDGSRCRSVNLEEMDHSLMNEG